MSFRVHVPCDGSTPRLSPERDGSPCWSGTRGPLRLLVAGEVIGDQRPLAPEAVLERYVMHGAACVHEIDGVFLLVALHADRREVVVLTDRVNGLKCFVEETPQGTDLSSSPRLLPRRAAGLDPVGVVSYLTNGAFYGGRTIHAGVRVLPRASVHVISAQGTSSHEYESFQLDGAFTGRSAQDLRDELGALLQQAVSRRAPCGQPLVLSLSGGESSTAVLGFLRGLERREARAFTYSHQPGDPQSEAAVAGRLAAAAGVEHLTAPSFAGDLDGFINRNVARGECRANLCMEIDAWDRLRDALPDEAVVLTGDGAFGWTGAASLKTANDVRDAVPLHASRQLGALAERLHLADACHVFDEELDTAAARGAHGDPADTRDFLFLEHRVPSLVMPWRELFPGRPVRTPFFDRDLLAFIRHVPATFRSGRRLLKETVYDLFPDLYGLDRTVRVPMPWHDIVNEQRTALENDLRSTSSPVDAWIPPAVALDLLRTIAEACAAARSQRREPPRTAAMPAAPRWLPALASPAQLLLRIIALRRFARNDAAGRREDS